MQAGFLRFKKKFLAHALLKSVFSGVSCAVAAACAIVVGLKLGGIAPNPLWFLPLGAAVGVLVGGLVFSFTYHSDKKLARRLDRALGLGEKVQTMLAFEGKEGEMLALQRKDADERLQKTPLKAVKTGKLWKHIFTPVLAVALLFGAIFTPLKILDTPVVGDPGWTISAWQRTRMENLIDEVQTSSMEETLKTNTAESLEALLSELLAVNKVSRMKTLVIGTIVKIDDFEEAANTNVEIAAAFSTSENEAVKRIATAVQTLNGTTLKQEIHSLFETLAGTEETPITVESSKVTAAERAVRVPLAALEVSEADGLYAAFTVLSEELKSVADGMENGQSAEWAKETLNAAFTQAEESAYAALLQQDINADIANYAIAELTAIFEIPESELPKDETGGSIGSAGGNGGDQNNEDKPLTGGGLGSGEVVYGSDDQIYYPDEDKFVSYGEVLTEFFNKASAQIFDEKVPEDIGQFIEDYFAKLYNGSATDEE